MTDPIIEHLAPVAQAATGDVAGGSSRPGGRRRGAGRAAQSVFWVLSSLTSAEDAVTAWMARRGLGVLRVGLGVVYLWFGALKFVPSLSPAEGLVVGLVGFINPRWLMSGLALWEVAIGLGLIFGVLLRASLALLFVHMAGTMLPLVVLRGQTWTRFPFAPTIEGQYILKNIVLLGAAIVVGGTLKRPLPASSP